MRRFYRNPIVDFTNKIKSIIMHNYEQITLDFLGALVTYLMCTLFSFEIISIQLGNVDKYPLETRAFDGILITFTFAFTSAEQITEYGLSLQFVINIKSEPNMIHVTLLTLKTNIF